MRVDVALRKGADQSICCFIPFRYLTRRHLERPSAKNAVITEFLACKPEGVARQSLNPEVRRQF